MVRVARLKWAHAVVGLLCLALASAVVVAWLPRWVNTPAIRSALCKEIAEATNLEASLAYVEVVPWRGWEVKARDLVLRARGQNDPVLRIPDIQTHLAFMKMLRGEISFRSLVLDGAEFLWNGSFDTDEKRLVGLREIRALLGMVPEIQVSNAIFRWRDGKIWMKILKGDFSSPSVDGRLTFQWTGEVWGDQTPLGRSRGRGVFSPEGQIWLVSTLDDLSLQAVSKVWQDSDNALNVQGTGSLRVQAKGTRSEGLFEGAWEGANLHLDWPMILGVPLLSPECSLTFKGQWGPSQWTLTDLRLETSNVMLEGEVHGDESGLRGMMTMQPFAFQDVVPYLGPGLIGTKLYGFFQEDLGSGKGKRATFQFNRARSLSGPEEPLQMRLEVDFQEASMIFDSHLPPLEDLEGTLFWEGRRVWFKDLKGTYLGHSFRSMEAQITEIGRVSLLEGKFAIDLKPPEIVDFLRRLSSERSIPKVDTDLKGVCSVDLTLDKALLVDRPLNYLANIDIKDAFGMLPFAPWKWQISSGKIDITPQTMRILDLKGAVEDSPLRFRGFIAGWSDESPQLRFSGNVVVDGVDLDRVVSWAVPGLEVTRGEPAGLAFSVSGAMSQPEIALSWDLTSMEIRYKDYWEKPLGHQMVVNALVQRVPQGAWRLTQGTLQDTGGEIRAEGWWGGGAGQRSWLQLQTKGYSVKALSKQMPLLSGKVRGGALDLVGEFYPGGGGHWMATAHPRDVIISDEIVGHEFIIRSGGLVFTDEWSEANPMELEVLGETYTFSGRLRSQQGGFALQGRVDGEEVDLGQWIFPYDRSRDEERSGREEGRPGPDMGESFFAMQNWISAFPASALEFHFKRIKLLNLVFRDITGRFFTEPDRVALECAKGHLEGGEVAFQGYLDEHGVFWFAGGVDGADAGAVLSTLGFREQIIKGPLYFQAGVDGRLVGRHLGDHEGNIELEIDKGVIRRFPVLANILSLLNITQFFMGGLPDLSGEGMPFKNIRGSFILKNGVAHIDDFRIHSEAMGVTIVGDLDLTRMESNFKVGVQPFVGLDRFVNAIPVFRHYVAGPDRSVLATYFLVNGPLSDPHVQPIPFRSLGEGILGFFERLLENPFSDLGPPANSPVPHKKGAAPPW
jgi:hypothetical protein